MTDIKYFSKIAFKKLKSSFEHDKFACSISLSKPEGSDERLSLKLILKVEKYVLHYIL